MNLYIKLHCVQMMKIMEFYCSKVKVAFYTEYSDVFILVHPVTMNQNLTEFIFYFAIFSFIHQTYVQRKYKVL